MHRKRDEGAALFDCGFPPSIVCAAGEAFLADHDRALGYVVVIGGLLVDGSDLGWQDEGRGRRRNRKEPGFIRNSINRSDDWSPQVRALASIVEACGYALVLESADDRIVLDDGFLQLARN